jgi:hypothetical protein
MAKVNVELKVIDLPEVKEILIKASEKIERYEKALNQIEKIMESNHYPKELDEIRNILEVMKNEI